MKKPEIEKLLLGSILNNKDIFIQTIDTLNVDMFTDHRREWMQFVLDQTLSGENVSYHGLATQTEDQHRKELDQIFFEFSKSFFHLLKCYFVDCCVRSDNATYTALCAPPVIQSARLSSVVFHPLNAFVKSGSECAGARFKVGVSLNNFRVVFWGCFLKAAQCFLAAGRQ